jgi:hypothetical protein
MEHDDGNDVRAPELVQEEVRCKEKQIHDEEFHDLITHVPQPTPDTGRSEKD